MIKIGWKIPYAHKNKLTMSLSDQRENLRSFLSMAWIGYVFIASDQEMTLNMIEVIISRILYLFSFWCIFSMVSSPSTTCCKQETLSKLPCKYLNGSTTSRQASLDLTLRHYIASWRFFYTVIERQCGSMVPTILPHGGKVLLKVW